MGPIGLAIAGAFLAASSALAAEPSREIAARTELHAFASPNLDDRAVLTGDATAGPALTVAGELRTAQGEGRRPLVVLVHGSGGIASNVEGWARALNAAGLSTFAFDGFTPRRAVSGDGPIFPGRLGMVVDAYRALELLARHPDIDPGRIALVGFSRGGQVALYAGLDRLDRLWNRSGARFAAFVPVYPDCVTTYRADEATAGPILVVHGAADDQNPPAPCRDYVGRLRAAGRDVRMVEYADAVHGFDDPLAPAERRFLPDADSVRRCRIREGEGGALLNVETGRPFAFGDACVERGTHAGRDVAAAAAARGEVIAFLRGLFRLP